MRFRWLVAAAGLLLSSPLVTAQTKNTGPTVEVRLRSVNDLVDRFEYVAVLTGKEDAGKQVRELLKALSIDGKGLQGIETKKPIGAYGTLSKEVETSPFVLFLPIADEETFLKTLNERFQIVPEKGENGTLKVSVPLINELHFRFTNGYVYVSPRAKDLDLKELVAPAAYFAKDDGAVASILVHLERIPAELRTFVLGQLELGINEERKKNAGNETAAEKRLKGFVLDAALAGVKGLTDDGKDLEVKFFADPKSDDLSAEIAVTAKSGTATAKNFAALGRNTSLPAGIVAAANPVLGGNLKIALTDGLKKEYDAVIDALIAEAMKKVPAEQEDVVKQIVATLSPTLKSGQIDTANSFIGPDSKGHYRLIGAATVKDGKAIEKLLKELVKQYGQFLEAHVSFDFDKEKVGDFTLHRIEFKETVPTFDKVFGSGVVWLATSDNCFAFTLEPEGETLRKALKARAVAVPVLSADVAISKLLPLVKPDLKPDEVKALIKDTFGDAAISGKDTVNLTIVGGESLSIKFRLKGKAAQLLNGANQIQGK